MARDLEAALAVAHRLADEARAAMRAGLADGFGVEHKDDGSPVTEVDRAVERALRRAVEQACPDDGVLGEEFGGASVDALEPWTWVFDPIDGTRAFAAGIPTFTTLIALLHEGRPVLGVIDQAVVARRWAAIAGGATRCNGAAVRARSCGELGRAILGSTAPQFVPAENRAGFARLEAATRDVQWGGDAFLYGALASGGLDLVAEAGLALHDFAALAPVVEGAGGRMVDWAGRPLAAGSAGDVLACADPARLEEALALLADGGAGGAEASAT